VVIDNSFSIKDSKTKRNTFIDKMSSLEEARKIQEEVSANLGK
jgi:hypothetical protein